MSTGIGPNACIVFVGSIAEGMGLTFYGIFDDPDEAEKFIEEGVDPSLNADWDYLNAIPKPTDPIEVKVDRPQIKLLEAPKALKTRPLAEAASSAIIEDGRVIGVQMEVFGAVKRGL